MKHRDWLRLQGEGEKICAVLRQTSYQCRKITRRLSWKVSKDEISYVLTWLPAPVGDWSLVPNDGSLAWQQLWAIVQNAIGTKDEEITSDRLMEESTRPWAIVRLLPDARNYVVARFYNRQDAQDHLRFLNRFMPVADFEIVFDASDSEKLDNSQSLPLSESTNKQ
jgi:hypothetical protein